MRWSFQLLLFGYTTHGLEQIEAKCNSNVSLHCRGEGKDLIHMKNFVSVAWYKVSYPSHTFRYKWSWWCGDLTVCVCVSSCPPTELVSSGKVKATAKEFLTPTPQPALGRITVCCFTVWHLKTQDCTTVTSALISADKIWISTST